MSEHDVLLVLGLLSEAYGQEPASVTGYVWALEEYPHDVLIQAARQAAKQHAWYPKPAEMRALCEEALMRKREREEPELARQRVGQLWELLVSGEITNAQYESDRAVQYLRRQKPQPRDIPWTTDTRTDAEIEKEWQEWKRQNADHDALKYHGPVKPRR